MPDPTEALFAEVHATNTTLLDRLRDKTAEIAGISADLQSSRNAVARFETTGDTGAARRAQRRTETLSARLEAARSERTALDVEHARLIERLAQRDSCDAPPDVPLLLLPVRIETRFNDAGNELRIRIYPDEIHVDRLDRGLSGEEVEAAQAYWGHIWALDDAEVGDDLARADAWKQLLAAVGAARAHWCARAMAPLNVADRGTGTPVFPEGAAQAGAVAIARMLPDRFVAIAQQGTKRSRAVGSPIPPEVRIGLFSNPDEPMTEQEGLKMLPGTEWLADFGEAKKKGLALTLTLSQPGKVDRLIVAGVQRSAAPARAAADFASLLEAHWESDGLAFLPQGTPTNNTETVRSAWQRRIEKSAPPATLPAQPADSNAGTLARALGINAPWLTAVDHAQQREQADAAAMNTTLWSATLGHFLGAVDKDNDAISTLDIERIRQFHRDYVRGRGTIPSLRVGNQPYGILPVSGFATLWKDDGADKFGGQLTAFLRKLRPNWKAGTSDLAHVGSGADLRETMDRLLGQSGVSYGVRARRCLSGSLVGMVSVVTPTAKPAAEIETMLARMLEEAIGSFSFTNLGATLDDKARPVLLPYADDARDPAFLEALLATGDGGKISSIFQALVALAAGREAAKPLPGRDFIDHLRLSTALDPAVRDAVVTQLARPGAADVATLVNLRKALPGSDSPNDRPAPRSFAMGGTIEPSFANYFGNVATAESREYLSVLVIDEFLRTNIENAEFRAALEHLAKQIGDPANQSRHVLVAETLDCVSHRLDSWITGAVSRRLAHQRRTKPEGLSVGAFGYVENLQPKRGQRDSGGYILAPSLNHAITAGILRAAHLTHAADAAGPNPYAIGLSSARVRDAMHLVDGIRQGQPLGALLGYRIERALQDAKLGHLVLNLRSLAPLVQGKLSDRGEIVSGPEQAIVSAAATTDGLRLVEMWRTPAGPGTIENALKSPPADNPYIAPGTAWSFSAADWNKVSASIAALDTSVDAVADLLLAESVHQVAQGNLARASAAMDASGRGDVAPPEPDVVSSLRGGQPVSHRLMIIGRDGGWDVVSPRARAAPGLEGWAAERLGDPARIVAGYEPGGAPVKLALGTIGALDLVALSSDAASAMRRATGNVKLDPAIADDPRLAAGEIALADVLVVADGLRRLLAAGRVAASGDFGLPGAPAAHAPEAAALTALASTLDDLALVLQQMQQALAALVASNSATLDSLSAALVALTDFGIATPSVSAAQLGETALLAAAEAQRRLVEYARLSSDPVDSESLALRAKALFGQDFALPIPQVRTAEPDLEVELDPVQPASIRRYLGDIATVRPQVRMFTDYLMLCDTLDGAPRLAVMQLGGEKGRWIADPLPDDAITPTAPVISIVADVPGEPPAALAGLVIDNWTETFPRRTLKGEGAAAKPVLETTAGVAIHADAPSSQPPQTMLLGISPDGARWTDDRVFDLVTETIEMARMRLVSLEVLPLAARVLPAIYTNSWSLQGEKTVDWSKFGDAFLKASVVGEPLRAFAMVKEN